MSSDPFPERIDTVKLFARNGAITAALPLDRLQRLTAYLSNKTGEVAVDLQFTLDEEGRRLLTGDLELAATVVCQRCLRDMPLELHSELHLLVFDTDQEVQELPDTQDAVVMEEAGLDLPALIEDELILSLPLVPVHEDVSCNLELNAIQQQNGSRGGEAKPNPFAVLAGMKVKTDK